MIICPPNLIPNWKREFQTWLTDSMIQEIGGLFTLGNFLFFFFPPWILNGMEK